jgi:hypothetical protein
MGNSNNTNQHTESKYARFERNRSRRGPDSSNNFSSSEHTEIIEDLNQMRTEFDHDPENDFNNDSELRKKCNIRDCHDQYHLDSTSGKWIDTPSPFYLNHATPGYRGKGPKNYKRSTNKILEEASEILMLHPDIDAEEIVVTINDDVICLGGTVPKRIVQISPLFLS